ncbi:hypothetical protein, conserved [Eimeria praecox]|uniref:Uncharacterized protein n=1 Tax=Eimeria praecox TaxID=51316 RepID=U6G4U6_9EIME|nr:hypothetical protein, conserved [Eimeria praecox]
MLLRGEEEELREKEARVSSLRKTLETLEREIARSRSVLLARDRKDESAERKKARGLGTADEAIGVMQQVEAEFETVLGVGPYSHLRGGLAQDYLDLATMRSAVSVLKALPKHPSTTDEAKDILRARRLLLGAAVRCQAATWFAITKLLQTKSEWQAELILERSGKNALENMRAIAEEEWHMQKQQQERAKRELQELDGQLQNCMTHQQQLQEKLASGEALGKEETERIEEQLFLWDGYELTVRGQRALILSTQAFTCTTREAFLKQRHSRIQRAFDNQADRRRRLPNDSIRLAEIETSLSAISDELEVLKEIYDMAKNIREKYEFVHYDWQDMPAMKEDDEEEHLKVYDIEEKRRQSVLSRPSETTLLRVGEGPDPPPSPRAKRTHVSSSESETAFPIPPPGSTPAPEKEAPPPSRSVLALGKGEGPIPFVDVFPDTPMPKKKIMVVSAGSEDETAYTSREISVMLDSSGSDEEDEELSEDREQEKTSSEDPVKLRPANDVHVPGRAPIPEDAVLEQDMPDDEPEPPSSAAKRNPGDKDGEKPMPPPFGDYVYDTVGSGPSRGEDKTEQRAPAASKSTDEKAPGEKPPPIPFADYLYDAVVGSPTREEDKAEQPAAAASKSTDEKAPEKAPGEKPAPIPFADYLYDAVVGSPAREEDKAEQRAPAASKSTDEKAPEKAPDDPRVSISAVDSLFNKLSIRDDEPEQPKSKDEKPRSGSQGPATTAPPSSHGSTGISGGLAGDDIPFADDDDEDESSSTTPLPSTAPKQGTKPTPATADVAGPPKMPGSQSQPQPPKNAPYTEKLEMQAHAYSCTICVQHTRPP